MKKLETYSLNEIKYLFSIDMSYFNITKRLDLKETNRNQNLNDAINSQKQDTKLILKSLYINLKLN
jgi:hypothetical protein